MERPSACPLASGRDPEENVLSVDLLVPQSVDTLVRELEPATVFDCVAFGAYSFETGCGAYL